ncbi:MAG: efflux RND transporter periplasmic adaptor subunit [Chromatiales bacterium]|jgi:RND family efflux transporter MFP subunit|nr:efflux RND transporter periplasmic adaptor subunit [Chromatiales bacterium]
MAKHDKAIISDIPRWFPWRVSRSSKAAALNTAGAIVAATLILSGCDEHHQPIAPASTAPALESIVVTPVQMSLERHWNGVVEAVNQATIAAQTAGRIVEILHDVNDFVPAGAVLLRLHATEQHAGLLAAQATLREATAREEEAQTQYQRIAAMYERKVVPKAALDDAATTRNAAQARLTAAHAAVDSAREGVSYTEVRAPYALVITQRLVQVGETASPGKELLSGLSLQHLRVNVDIPQSAVVQIRRLKQATVEIGAQRITATRVTVFPEGSVPSSTFRTRLDLPANATDLYPGMWVKTSFTLGEIERLLVPPGALVERSELTAVYIINPNGRTSMRQVRLGERFQQGVEVLAGLVAGERVALDPVAAVKALQPAPAASRLP